MGRGQLSANTAIGQTPGARQNDPNFGELAGLCVDLNRPAMLLDDDVVTDRQPKPRTLAGGLGREEGVEYLFLHLGRNAGAVVADVDLHAVAEAARRGGQSRLETFAVACALRLAAA